MSFPSLKYQQPPLVSSYFSGGSRLETRDISGNCCVTSRGKLFSHLRSSSSLLRRTARYATGSVMLRPFYPLDSTRWLVSVGVKARVQRADWLPGCPCAEGDEG